MPFQNERASYAPLRRILQSEKVRKLQARFRRVDAERTAEDVSQAIAPRVTQVGGRRPDLLLAIDGGYVSADVDTGYPGAEIGYITVAAVLILVDKLREVAASDIIDPVEHRKTQRRSSVDTAVPGARCRHRGRRNAGGVDAADRVRRDGGLSGVRRQRDAAGHL